jgi:restriction system protein
LPIAILAGIFKSPWFKGVVGEAIVNTSAKLMLDKEKYYLIKNVTLPTEDGSTQIDHIVVSIYGIFVVETKNMKGWIFGSPHQKTWTQKTYKHSSKFQNPLHQNYKHVKNLKLLLGVTDEQIFSLVVFVGDSAFKTEMPENVTYSGGYARFIKTKTKQVLSRSEVEEITSKIESRRLVPSFKTSRDHVMHVMHVKNIVKAKEEINNKLCPKCGIPMVLREAKKGVDIGKKFWGCSSFPKCRAIVNAT